MVLGQLLAGVLEPIAEQYGTEAVAAAARLVGDARERIGEEIYLVPHHPRDTAS